MPTGYRKEDGHNPFEGQKRPPFSVEHRRKMSDAKKGKRSPKKGLPGKSHSLETRKKMSAMRQKDKHWNWMGGISPLNNAIRACFKYRQWRSDVFSRDGFRCVTCGGGEHFLEADHIKPFSLILKENNIMTLENAITCEELWNINNGQTLCKKHHAKKTYH